MGDIGSDDMGSDSDSTAETAASGALPAPDTRKSYNEKRERALQHLENARTAASGAPGASVIPTPSFTYTVLR